MSNQSEVARLMQQIEQEITAMQAAQYGFASVARHEVITHHYEALDTQYQQLATYIGAQQAIETVIKRMEEIL